MSHLPEAIVSYLRRFAVETQSLAWLLVDKQERLLESGGAVEHYHLQVLQAGDLVTERLHYLYGILPITGESAHLPVVEVEEKVYADIHVFADAEAGADWVVFLGLFDRIGPLRATQQRAHENVLLKVELRRLRDRLGRQDLAVSEGLVLAEYLTEQGVACLSTDDRRKATWLSRKPSWVEEFPAFGAEEVDLRRLGSQFPFLEYFLDDALKFWGQEETGAIHSGLWAEQSAAGKRIYLEATAALVFGEKLLIIANIGGRVRERQDILQRSREGKLRSAEVLSEKSRELDQLMETNDELERRVDERTGELGRLNERLQREIGDRKAAADALVKHQARLRALALELLRAEESERRRIAAGLHDDVGQLLASIKIRLGALRQSSDSAPYRQELDEVYSQVHEAIQHTRSLTFEMGTPVLYELGLAAALESLAEDYQRTHGLTLQFETTGESFDLDTDNRVILYQATRELLFNVTKHSRATRATIQLIYAPDSVRIDVSDDGCGFDPAIVDELEKDTSSYGLFNVRERLTDIGGHLEIDSVPGHGARVSLVAPRVVELSG